MFGVVQIAAERLFEDHARRLVLTATTTMGGAHTYRMELCDFTITKVGLPAQQLLLRMLAPMSLRSA
jgi:hypothetical protein